MTERINCTVLVTPRSFGVGDKTVREQLEAAVSTVRYNSRGRALTAEELRAEVGDIDAMIAGVDEIDSSVFAAAPHLRVIARYGVGVDNVDLKAAQEYGVIVTNTPGANTEAVAELTIGLLFALARSIPRVDRAVHSGKWLSVQGCEVAGKTVGLLGFGKIGQAVARRATALGCTVMAYDPYIDQSIAEKHQVRLGSLHAVTAAAHFLSLHLPLTKETQGLIDRALLAQLQPGSFLINTARGELIVEQDLLWALDNGHLRGAALDALTEEPPDNHPFQQREDIILTSHVGAHTVEAAINMGRDSVRELLTVLTGQKPRFAVTPLPGEHS